MDGGASGFIEAHAGFGLFLTTDHEVAAVGRSFKTVFYKYIGRAVGIGANATTEGGIEFTALEDGQLIASTSHKLWRSRVSTTFGDWDEEASGQEGPYAEFEPRELAFTMRPGHGYTFNVGISGFLRS